MSETHLEQTPSTVVKLLLTDFIVPYIHGTNILRLIVMKSNYKLNQVTHILYTIPVYL